MRLFGIETEYGITREDLPEMDSVVESMELVRAHLTSTFERTWDYRAEDPHQDERGFRVSGLEQDQEEDEFVKQDAHRPFSFHEMKSDLVLPNGARFYNDHTHPEYSSPECRTLRDLVAHDRAGERLVFRAAQRRNRQLAPDGQSTPVQLYKNNTDFHGHSYGCHDNYLLSRSIPFPTLAEGLIPFLVSRQVIAGAGKVGVESQDSGYTPGRFQLSQRADFMEVEMSVNTMHNRPILNTRDEPHADRTKYRRLHLIVGDANMCEYATALKVGTTQLVLDAIERGPLPPFTLENPVEAIKQLSHDLDFKTAVRLTSGKTMTGLELQEAYCEYVQRTLSQPDEDTAWILREWTATLQALRHNRQTLVGKVDWITKQWLLQTFVEEERLAWDDPWLASLDLEYHNVDPERGLFLGLEAEGKCPRLTTDADVTRACTIGPSDTRGGLRGLCVRRFPDAIDSIQWERVTFRNGLIHTTVLDMQDLFDPEDVLACGRIIEQAKTPQDALYAWQHR
jgi:proteasome accessory factor A